MSRKSRAALAFAVVLFGLVTVIRFSSENVADAYSLLYALPIAVAALTLGRRKEHSGFCLTLVGTCT